MSDPSDNSDEAYAAGIPPLLPCPFCGHAPRRDNFIDSLHPVGRMTDYWEFSCLDNEGGCNATVYGDTRMGAIEAWNRRALPIAASGLDADARSDETNLCLDCPARQIPQEGS